jgi:hypothetical protein
LAPNQSERDMADDEDNLTNGDIRRTLHDELGNMKREYQLREKEATELVAAIDGGKISVADANKRFEEYLDRWGEAFRGYLLKTEGVSDEELLQKYDGQRRRFSEGRSSSGFER